MDNSDPASPALSRSRTVFGYRSEIAEVVAALEDADCAGALVVGAAGMGKTTVLNASLARLPDTIPVVRFRGSDSVRSRSLGVFEILFARWGIDGPLLPGPALSTLARLFDYGPEVPTPVVVVDNAERVDGHSLSVLGQLADSRRIRLLAAAESIRAPIDLIAALWLGGTVRRIDLEGIDAEAAAAMVVAAQRDGDPLLRDIVEHARPNTNPSLLKGLLRAGQGSTHLNQAFDRLDRTDTDIIEMVALMGAVPYDALIGVAAPMRVDALVEVGLLDIARGRRAAVTIREPAVADSLFTAVRPSRSLELFKLVSAGIDLDSWDGRALYGYVRWAQSLGERQPVDRVFAAVLWANSRGRYAAAIEMVQTSAAADDRLELELCRALKATGDVDSAAVILDRLLAEAAPENEERYLSRLASMELRMTDPRSPEQLKATWVRDRLSDPVDIGRLEVTRALFELRAGRVDAAASLAERVYRDHSCSSRHRLRACAFLGVADVFRGWVEKGLSLVEQSRLMMDLPGMTTFEFSDAFPQYFIAYLMAGEWDSAKSVMRAPGMHRSVGEVAAALVDIRTGRVSKARSVLQRLRATDAIDQVEIGDLVRSGLAYTSQAPATDPAIGEKRRTTRVRTYSWWAEFEADLLGYKAMAAASPDAAADGLWRLGESAEGRQAHALSLLAWIEAAQLGDPRAVRGLPIAAAHVDGPLRRLAISLAEAHRSDEPAGFFEAARDANACGLDGLCARLARIARDMAVDRRDAQVVRRASALLRASERAIAFGPEPARLQAVLTHLERDLVDGVREGRSNAELGEELHLSVRTVEWHLGRIYRALHVANRRELREVVRTWGEQ